PETRTEWVEPQAATAHMLGVVAPGPLAALTKGLPEYESGPAGLWLTLLRSVRTISRPAGLPTRPLSAGADLPTPDAPSAGARSPERSRAEACDAARPVPVGGPSRQLPSSRVTVRSAESCFGRLSAGPAQPTIRSRAASCSVFVSSRSESPALRSSRKVS